jgi:hypothetical protein
MPGYRQEVFNVLLAQLLQERGVIAAPENIIKSSVEQHRHMPDVLVSFNGLRTAIEGEVGDHADAQALAVKSARYRVEEGIAHIGIAIVYPPRLRNVQPAQIKSELAKSELDVAIVTESGDSGFVKGNVDYLESALRHAFEQLLHEDVVAQAVKALDEGIDQFALVMAEKGGVTDRMAEALGIRGLPERESSDEEDSE